MSLKSYAHVLKLHIADVWYGIYVTSDAYNMKRWIAWMTQRSNTLYAFNSRDRLYIGEYNVFSRNEVPAWVPPYTESFFFIWRNERLLLLLQKPYMQLFICLILWKFSVLRITLIEFFFVSFDKEIRKAKQ